MSIPLPILAVSGRPADQGGTGELIGTLARQIAAEKLPMDLRHPRQAHPVLLSLREGRFLRAASEPFRREAAYRRLGRLLQRFGQQPNPMLIFHPQSLGLRRVVAAVRNRSAPTWLFLLDASPFCRKSYNSIEGEWVPCSRCLGNDGADSERLACQPPFRRDFSMPAQHEFRRLGREGRFRLLAQTLGHGRLVQAHFGQDVPCHVVGLEVPGLEPPGEVVEESGYDVVFHAAPVWNKGVGVLFALAPLLPEFRLLAPFAIEEVKRDVSSAHWPLRMPANITFQPMRWNSGLREEIRRAKLILCPSVWSAPIEGAVLKSLNHNGVTALFRGKGQFGEEIPAAAVVELDASDLARSARAVSDVLRDASRRATLRLHAASFIEDFKKRYQGIGRRLCDLIIRETR